MAEKYHPALRVLHWLIALLILGMIALGWYMTGLPKEAPSRGELYALHKSIGVTIFFLLLLRMMVRLSSTVPPLPAAIPVWERKTAEATHAIFYIFMCVMPLSGYLMTNGFGFPVKWFGVELPRLIAANRPLGELARTTHEIIAYTFLALIGLHVAGVIKHRYFDKNDILPRMWW